MSLRELIERTAREHGLRRVDLTFSGNDPFTNDTPGNRAWAEWIMEQIDTPELANRTIHPRGFHYVLVTRAPAKPDGTTYRNTEVDFNWSKEGLRLARWLGYLPFDRVADNRNTPPTMRAYRELSSFTGAAISSGVDRDAIPEEDWTDDLHPRVEPLGMHAEQPYRLVLVGEKSSLEPVLQPLSERYRADLYLPSGDISDTLVWQMARTASEDGRPMIAFYFSDCDPAGWNMPHALSRKLQALQAVHFPDLDWRVIHAGLKPEQVKDHDLPTSPLQNKRPGVIERWRRAFGIEQTEIDAMATLQPDLLREIALTAIRPYFDSTLSSRLWRAQDRWRTAAQEVLSDALDQERYDLLISELRLHTQHLRSKVDEINALMPNVADLDLPEREEVTPEVTDDGFTVDSRWPFLEQVRVLKARRAYEE